MKRIFLYSAVALSALLTSCGKEDDPPVPDKNSKVVITGTKYYNLTIADSVFQSVAMKFLVKKSDTTLPPDTIESTQRYMITDPYAVRTIYFNTPANTIRSEFILRAEIYGAFADSVSVDNFTYQKDGQTLISQPVPFNGSGIQFISNPLTYNF
jgi:hypothetical protein